MSKHAFIETELGLLPNDWQIVKLGEIGPFYKGAGISREDSHSGSIPAVRYGEIYTTHDNYIFKCTSFISPLIAKQSRRIHKGYILFTGSGETKEDIGKAVAFIDDYEAYAGGDIIILSPKKAYDPLYLGFFLNSSPVIRQRASLAQGDSVVHITAEALKEIRLALPPTKEEQSRIASALFDIDTLIRDLDRTIEKKQNIRQGAMKQLLSGKKRLPGFKGEWKQIRLSDVFFFGKGKGLKKEELSESGKYKCILYGEIFTQYDYIVKSVVSKTDKYEGTLSRRGDILMPGSTTTTGIDLIKAVSLNENNVLLGGDVIILRPKDTDCICSDFMAYLISVIDRKALADVTQGTTIIHLHTTNMVDVGYTIPPTVKEQTAIANLLIAMDDEIAMLQLERTKYANIRSGMMNDLLSGTKRL